MRISIAEVISGYIFGAKILTLFNINRMRMRKFTLLLALAGLFAVTTAHAQAPGTKGSGQVFYSQTFGWGKSRR